MFRRKLEKLNLDNSFQESNFWRDAFVRFSRNKLAMTSLITLIVIIACSIIIPMTSYYAYDYIDWSVSFPSPPSWSNKHYLGTDGNGRDLFVRLFMGVRISLMVGILASMVSLTIGVLWGSIAGFIGGKTDLIMMRIVDILYGIPFMFVLILLVVVFGRNIYLIFIAIGAVSWLTMARIVRGQTLSIKNKEFIEATRSYSLPSFFIVLKHIIPNLIGTVIVYVSLTIPGIILFESFLSFLGLGVQEPNTSLGVLISEGASVIENYLWVFLAPAILLSMILFCFNFIGDGLRDAFDQKAR